jgi:hypothetical protein
MSRSPRQTAVTVAAALVAACLLAPAASATQPTLHPLPASDYSVSPACSVPAAYHAGCLAMHLTPRTAQAQSHTHPIGVPAIAGSHHGSPAAEGLLGLRPSDLHSVYELPYTTETTQTIAVVDAYNDPTAATDLAAYEHEFSLSSCTGGECFRQVGQTGGSGEANLPFPKSTHQLEQALGGSESEVEEAEEAIGWGVEISLDIETARAICQNCHILLVEADSTSVADLAAAEETAYRLGAEEISNSWGSAERTETSTTAFDHPGTVITASTGDDGYRNWDYPSERGYPNFPASSPDVVAVGGTRLGLAEGSTWRAETVWNGAGASGGGCSRFFSAQSWQEQVADWGSVGCGHYRAAADVAADADPYTGVAITDSDDPGEQCEEKIEGSPLPDWCTYGGTSLASPLIASVFALAGGAHGAPYPAHTLYETLRHAPGMLHDVTIGSNGECRLKPNSEGLSSCEPSQEAATSCHSTLICLAHLGYDGPSGVGTPHGVRGFQPGAEEAGAVEPGAEPAKSTSAESSGAIQATAPAAPAPAPAPAPIVSSVPVKVELTDLSLTAVSRTALSHRHLRAATVAYSFVLNLAARVRLTLARRTRSGHGTRWATVGTPSMFGARAGRSSKHLTGVRTLAPGLYRLTLAPIGGRPRTIYFSVA